MFKVYNISDDQYHIKEKDKILEYCKKSFLEKSQPSHINMWAKNWETQSNTLPYILYLSSRFAGNNGDMFFLVDDNENIIANSGINVSDFDKNVAIGGVRTWLDKSLRGKFVVGRHLLPYQLKWAKNKNLKTIALTFNDYNKKLIPYFKRSGFGIEKKRNSDSLFYNGQYTVDFPVMINYTKQWVIYHKIDSSYEPLWEKIKVKE